MLAVVSALGFFGSLFGWIGAMRRRRFSYAVLQDSSFGSPAAPPAPAPLADLIEASLRKERRLFVIAAWFLGLATVNLLGIGGLAIWMRHLVAKSASALAAGSDFETASSSLAKSKDLATVLGLGMAGLAAGGVLCACCCLVAWIVTIRRRRRALPPLPEI